MIDLKEKIYYLKLYFHYFLLEIILCILRPFPMLSTWIISNITYLSLILKLIFSSIPLLVCDSTNFSPLVKHLQMRSCQSTHQQPISGNGSAESLRAFEIVKTIGEGTFAKVYKVINRYDGISYAMKRCKIG